MEKRGGYGIVYQNVLRNPNISIEGKAVYAYLAGYAGTTDECFPGISLMCEELGISKSRLYKHMAFLIASGVVEKKQTYNGNIKGKVIYRITHIVNEDFSVSEKSGSRDLGKPENSETIINSFKSNNKYKSKTPKSIKCYFSDNETLNQAFIDYVEMRKQIKKPMTDRAVELAIKKLHELATVPFSDAMDNNLAVQILNQSILNSWQGLFPLKQQKTACWHEKGGDAGGTGNQTRGQASDYFKQFIRNSDSDQD
ncbi:MAG: helix-turn-helix domain-containing protein [Lachnospiraceae bacterium]|nr:helix-turn-helix domain-containing protein [Lachnospiraceae bacterium]